MDQDSTNFAYALIEYSTNSGANKYVMFFEFDLQTKSTKQYAYESATAISDSLSIKGSEAYILFRYSVSNPGESEEPQNGFQNILVVYDRSSSGDPFANVHSCITQSQNVSHLEVNKIHSIIIEKLKWSLSIF